MNHHPDEVWIQLFINLSRYIDSKISSNGRHSAQVAQWVRSTARKLALTDSEINNLYWASLLHDIGKLGIPDDVLAKNGPLTQEEWTLMRLHPTIGANIVKSLKSIAHIAPFIHYHQEKFDGTGYPMGLHGEDIPFGARILAVVDAYDAMVNDRVYRQALCKIEAVNELKNLAGQHFDPLIVNNFLEVVDSESI